MAYSLEREYEALLSRQLWLRQQAKTLPGGYISQKTIRGKTQFYLQRRQGGKVLSAYIRAEDAPAMREKLEAAEAYRHELEQIALRLQQLEQAADLIGEDMGRRLMLIKLSCGMDGLGPEQKQQCTSFGTAMTAVEGVAISRETAEDIARWQRGEQSFLHTYESALARYGFPVEVNP